MAKLYAVPGNTVDLLQDGKVTAPSREELAKLTEAHVATSKENNLDSWLAFENLEDAIKVANEYDPQANGEDGFFVVELHTDDADLDTLEKQTQDYRISARKKGQVEGYVVDFDDATVKSFHLGHLSDEFSDDLVVAAEEPAKKSKAKKAPAKAADKPAEESANPAKKKEAVKKDEEKTEEKSEEKAKEENKEEAKEESSSIFSVSRILTVLGITGAAAAATYTGLTTSVLASFGYKAAGLGLAGTFGVSFGIAAIGAGALYGVVKGLSAAGSYLFSSKEEENNNDKEDKNKRCCLPSDKEDDKTADAALGVDGKKVVSFAAEKAKADAKPASKPAVDADADKKKKPSCK